MTSVNIERQKAMESGAKTYFTGIPCRRGHLAHRRVANRSCLQCSRDSARTQRAKDVEADREKSRQWYEANKDRAKQWKRDWIKANPERYVESRKKWRSSPSSRAREMIASSKWAAKKKGIPYDIDRAWLMLKLEAGVCELTGIPFQLEPLDGGRQNPYTASLDRIVPSKGYVKGNVRVILWALNAAFNSYGEDVYAKIAKVYLAKHGTGLT